MAETIKGINVVIGSDTTGLSAALADVNKSSREIQSELSKVERLLKFNPKDTELLAQKQKLLGDQVATTKEKLDRLKTAQAQVNEQFKKGDITEGQYRAFRREIIETESKLKHFETQLKNTQGPAVFARQMEQAGKKMQELGDKAAQVGKNLSMAVTLPVIGAGAAAFKMAADVEDALGATEQTFKSAAAGMKNWAANLESYYGIAEGEALEYGNMMGSMLQNIGGLTEEQAADQAQTLIKLAGDLTAMYGGTTADAVRALTGALKGNNTMLDNYGMAVNDAMVKTKAYEMGLYDGTGQMDLAAKQAATLALIMEQSGAAQGQAAREAEGASGAMRSLMTELKNLATTFGQVLLPIITPFIAKITEMVKWFKNLSPATKQTIVLIAGVAAAIGPLLIGLGKLTSAVGVLVPLFGKMSTALSGISLSTVATVAGIAALAIVAIEVYRNWKQVQTALAAIWDLIKASAVQLGINIAIVFERMKNAVLNVINEMLQRLAVFEKLPFGIGEKFAGLKDAISDSTEQSAARIDELKQAAESHSKNIRAAIDKTKVSFGDLGAAIANDIKSIMNIFKQQETEHTETTDKIIQNNERLKQSTITLSQAMTDAIRNRTGELVGFSQNIAGQLQSISNARYQNQIGELDNYYEAEKERIENSYLAEEEKQAQIAALDAEVQKRRRAAARKQAEKDKEFSTFETIINTAQAVARTLAQWGWPLGPVFAAAIGALGAAQLKAIKSQPLPALAEGGLATKETIARIGERKDRVPEAVLPLTQKILSGIGEGIAANMPQQSGGGGLTVILHIHGNVIGDKAGMRKLAQEVFSYEYSVKRRLGGAEA